MKNLVLIFCLALLAPQNAAQAHQERHVHSQWITQQLSQLTRTIGELKARIQKLEQKAPAIGTRMTAGAMVLLDEKCGPDQQKLCQKSCATGWKIGNASCIGSGNIGQTNHQGRGISCYCIVKNDPNCFIHGVTASCTRR